MPKAWGMRRIAETHSHLRGSRNSLTAMFPSPEGGQIPRPRQGLYPPHTGRVTVTGTGTLQPTSCGKGPTAVGKSVMVLPGNPQGAAARLTGKGSDRSRWGQSRCSSQGTGRPSTGRRAAVQGATGRESERRRSTPAFNGTAQTPPRRASSVCKDSLGGKAGCAETCPSGLEGGLRKHGY
jgi:hypothetical protein